MTHFSKINIFLSLYFSLACLAPPSAKTDAALGANERTIWNWNKRFNFKALVEAARIEHRRKLEEVA